MVKLKRFHLGICALFISSACLLQSAEAQVDACAAAQASDLNNDSEVTFADITLLFGHWGHSHDGIPDPDGDGLVSFGDIFFMLPWFGPVADHCVEAIDLCGNLDLIREDLSADYILSCDIDLNGVDFEPIGTMELPFSGTLDGQGHVISNFTLNQVGGTGIGLFGAVVGGTIENLSVLDAQLNTLGAHDVGILAGFTNSSLIENCHTSGLVTGNLQRTGGVIGHADPGTIIRNCSSLATVEGGIGAGGISGVNHGSLIEDCIASGNVTGHERVGGLLGYTFPDEQNGLPTITRDSTASGNIVGLRKVGGFVGYNLDGEIENSSASGGVHATGHYTGPIGGFVGYHGMGTLIINSSAHGAVTGEGAKVGGFAGYIEGGTIENSIQTGNVDAWVFAGSFSGYNEGATIRDSRALGNVVAPGNGIGGFAGALVGGSLIERVSASGNVTGSGQYTGGLAGYMFGATVSESFATGNVVSYHSVVGGLVGAVQPLLATADNIIRNSYATGNVGALDDGGHAGSAAALVASLNAGLNDDGEFIAAIVENCYATGEVTAPVPSTPYATRGLIFSVSGPVEIANSYWNTQTTGQETSAGGEGRTTAEMTSVPRPENTYVDWNFDSVWQQTNGAYPTLQALP